jgi:hypothetical protein
MDQVVSISSTSEVPPSDPHRNLYLLPAFLGAYLVIYFFIGERAPFNGGLGFDGVFYGHLAQDVPEILNKRIPEYYLDRILPSLVVWLAARASGVALSSPDRIVSAFHIYNSLLLLAAAFAWVRLSRTLALSTETAVIGAACLFLNWIVAKQYLYFVVQTDTTAFAAGVLVSLCVIERRLYLLVLTAFVASFAFKTIMPMAMFLIVFPTPAADRQPSWLESRLPLASAALAVLITLYALFWERLTVIAGGAQLDMLSLPLSIIVLAGYVWYIAHSIPFTRILASARIRGFKPIGFFFALWIARLALLSIMAKLFASDVAILDTKRYLLGSFVVAVAKPAVFLIAHVVSFGPSFILFLCNPRRIFDAAALHSAGAALFLIAMMAMSINSESRVLAFAYPLLVTFLCITVQRVGVTRGFVWVFLACSLLLSRCYLPLNALGMSGLPRGPMTDVSVLLQFPSQWFFMMIGPYMNWISYGINLCLFIIGGGIMIALCPGSQKHQSREYQALR